MAVNDSNLRRLIESVSKYLNTQITIQMRHPCFHESLVKFAVELEREEAVVTEVVTRIEPLVGEEASNLEMALFIVEPYPRPHNYLQKRWKGYSHPIPLF